MDGVSVVCLFFDSLADPLSQERCRKTKRLAKGETVSFVSPRP